MEDTFRFEGALIITVGLLFLFFMLKALPISIWFTAHITGLKISFLQLLLMKWRKTDVNEIVKNLIIASKSGITVNRDDLEALHLAGGNVSAVVHALIIANKSNIDLSFKEACAIELAGKDVIKLTQLYIDKKEQGVAISFTDLLTKY
jgi:uncharacterized protein YqfA (UPF0365 family)